MPKNVGGLVGKMIRGSLNNAYYVGVININATNIGGLVGVSSSPIPQMQIILGYNCFRSLCKFHRKGFPTSTLKTKTFWTTHFFSQSIG